MVASVFGGSSSYCPSQESASRHADARSNTGSSSAAFLQIFNIAFILYNIIFKVHIILVYRESVHVGFRRIFLEYSYLVGYDPERGTAIPFQLEPSVAFQVHLHPAFVQNSLHKLRERCTRSITGNDRASIHFRQCLHRNGRCSGVRLSLKLFRAQAAVCSSLWASKIDKMLRTGAAAPDISSLLPDRS